MKCSIMYEKPPHNKKIKSEPIKGIAAINLL